jgi:hypothetical protein
MSPRYTLHRRLRGPKIGLDNVEKRILYILICKFLASRQKDRKFLNRTAASVCYTDAPSKVLAAVKHETKQ